MKKIISKVLVVLIVVVTIWFVWSVIDVNTHNNPTGSNYKDYSNGNAIIMLNELFN